MYGRCRDMPLPPLLFIQGLPPNPTDLRAKPAKENEKWERFHFIKCESPVSATVEGSSVAAMGELISVSVVCGTLLYQTLATLLLRRTSQTTASDASQTRTLWTGFQSSMTYSAVSERSVDSQNGVVGKVDLV